MRKWINLNHSPFCGKVHPIQNVLFKSNPSGFLVRFKIVPKENKNEETGEEKEREERRRSGVRAIKWSKCIEM